MTIVLNRQKAVEYAQKYWDEESGNYNKLFPHFDGNDCCTEIYFVCLPILFLNVGKDMLLSKNF